MKNILVPTDFSACANDATDVALALAELTGARLHLFHQLDIPEDWEELSEEEQAADPEALQSIHKIQPLFAEWTHKASERGVPILTNYAGGKLVEHIKDYVQKENIDFTVMGSHGASGKNEFFIGSNTQRTVRTLHTPVLIIKEPLAKYEFKKVVFASDFSEKEKDAFSYFLEFIRPFKAEIHLVAINTMGFFTQPYVLVKESMKDFAAMAAPLKCKKHFYRDFSVDAGIRHLSEEIGAQLIGISNHQRHPLKRMLTGSNVEALVNHADIPLLSIDY